MFNQDWTTPFPTGRSFNVAFGTNSLAAGPVNYWEMSAGFGGANTILMVTPLWRNANAYNNHPTGVWYDGGTWQIVNEDLQPMPSGMAFNVHWCDPNDGAYIHVANSSNTFGDWTMLDNPNLNNQPGAKVLVTHNLNPPGATLTLNPHPIGVYYISAFGRWAIFNQDQQPMPNTAAFNVWVAP